MEIDVDEVEEVDGSSGGVRGALQRLLCLLDPGGAPGFDSGDGGANVVGEVASVDQWREVGVVVCSNRRERVGFYSLDGGLRIVIHDDGGHGDQGHRGHGRWHGGVQGAQSIVMRVPAQEEVVKHSGLVTRPSSSTATVVELHGGYRSSAREWACPSASWC